MGHTIGHKLWPITSVPSVVRGNVWAVYRYVLPDVITINEPTNLRDFLSLPIEFESAFIGGNLTGLATFILTV